ncbi:alpha/beta hydrolase fold [Lucifera butyrica]|uniref:Alpha/beta hydrolase fold n=1 Tax=Lucifera butyrica TaxID=1351585 RepID=A0A498R4C3_9FIRM|nr:alpha/beta fold hydrolase [Lucifera butyrica]VBB05122.1 alpha/beta hydrolase fold [Lucifera butyrica]
MTSIHALNPWIPYRRPHPAARLRLFCFPYAGGSASVFRDWFSLFPPEIDICPIQYPGRERRITEPQFTLLPSLLDALVNGLAPELKMPFAFFGHSLGALVSFELARRLQKRGMSPLGVFISGYRAPVVERKKPPMHLLPDNAFIARLREYNGTPELILQNSEMMQVLLPTLRADFALHETYVYSGGMPLTCPLSILGGMEDPDITYQDLNLWEGQTVNDFKVRMFPGDHFYLHDHCTEVVNAVQEDLALYETELMSRYGNRGNN